MGQEKRQKARKKPNQLVYVDLGSDNGGILLNASEDGFSFRAVGPIVAGGPIPFQITIGKGRKIEGHGHLSWTDESKKVGGLRFTNPSPELLAQVREWLAENAPPPPERPNRSFASAPESQARQRRAQLRAEPFAARKNVPVVEPQPVPHPPAPSAAVEAGVPATAGLPEPPATPEILPAPEPAPAEAAPAAAAPPDLTGLSPRERRARLRAEALRAAQEVELERRRAVEEARESLEREAQAAAEAARAARAQAEAQVRAEAEARARAEAASRAEAEAQAAQARAAEEARHEAQKEARERTEREAREAADARMEADARARADQLVLEARIAREAQKEAEDLARVEREARDAAATRAQAETSARALAEARQEAEAREVQASEEARKIREARVKSELDALAAAKARDVAEARLLKEREVARRAAEAARKDRGTRRDGEAPPRLESPGPPLRPREVSDPWTEPVAQARPDGPAVPSGGPRFRVDLGSVQAERPAGTPWRTSEPEVPLPEKEPVKSPAPTAWKSAGPKERTDEVPRAELHRAAPPPARQKSPARADWKMNAPVRPAAIVPSVEGWDEDGVPTRLISSRKRKRWGIGWVAIVAILVAVLLGVFHRQVGQSLVWLGKHLSGSGTSSGPGSGPQAGPPEARTEDDAAAGKSETSPPAEATAPREAREEGSAPSGTADRPAGRAPAASADVETVGSKEIVRGEKRPPHGADDVQTLWTLVEAGNAAAELKLAERYLMGDGVERNCNQARVLLEASAKKGNAQARQTLAQLGDSGCS